MNAEEEEIAINQMKEFTDCDDESARLYLSRCNFNVEVAVQNFFEFQGFVPDEQIHLDQNAYDTFENIIEEEVVENIEPQSVEREPSHAVLPYYPFLKFFADLITFPVRLPIYFLFLVFDYVFKRKESEKFANIHAYITKKFPQYVSKKNNFYDKSLSELQSNLRSNNWKYVIAYIHDEHSDPSFFISCLESNISRLISQHKGILFGTMSNSGDAKRLIPDRFRQAKSFLIIYQVVNYTMNKKLIIDDLSDPEAVNRNLQLILYDLTVEETEREAIRNAHNESRKLMEMQNQEYEESLQQDRLRIAKEKEEKEAAERLKQEEIRRQKLNEERIKKIQDFKKELNSVNSETTSDSVNATNELQIRFPAGRKIIKFDPKDKLMKIFIEAMKDEKCPLFVQMHLSFPRTAIPCLPQWYFDILMLEELEPKPECLDKGLTFEDAGIAHGYLIFVDNL